MGAQTVERAFILLHGFRSGFQELPVELESTQGSVLKGDLSLEKTFLAATPNLRTTSPHSYYNAVQTISIPGGMNIAWNLRARRRVFLAVAPKPEVDMGMEMRSDDIAFETPSSVHSYRGLRDERHWYNGRIEKRGEEYVRNLRYRLFVFELPLEEK